MCCTMCFNCGMVHIAKFGSVFMEHNVVDWMIDRNFCQEVCKGIGSLLLACHTIVQIFFQQVSPLLAFHWHVCHTTAKGAL